LDIGVFSKQGKKQKASSGVQLAVDVWGACGYTPEVALTWVLCRRYEPQIANQPTSTLTKALDRNTPAHRCDQSTMLGYGVPV
jgi:hypothetical protein